MSFIFSMWWKFLPFMSGFILFTIVCLPFFTWLIFSIQHVAKGGEFGEYSWDDNYHLKFMNDFYEDVLNANDAEEKAIAVILIFLVGSLLWGITIPFLIYIWYVIDKRAKKQQYEDFSAEQDRLNKQREREGL